MKDEKIKPIQPVHIWKVSLYKLIFKSNNFIWHQNITRNCSQIFYSYRDVSLQSKTRPHDRTDPRVRDGVIPYVPQLRYDIPLSPILTPWVENHYMKVKYSIKFIGKLNNKSFKILTELLNLITPNHSFAYLQCSIVEGG